jgi:dihydropteroate synthase
MAIMNVTPDSFSDGGKIQTLDVALRRAEELIAEGADILDVGGESTRPGSRRISLEEEVHRVVPISAAIAERFQTPISVDTTKSQVAERALAAGAEIVNDISGLRWDEKIAQVAAENGAGLVLMHSRGEFESMHTEPPVGDIFADVSQEFRTAIGKAERLGVARENIALDVGIGFGKTQEQNLELIAKLGKIVSHFPEYPMLVGVSRKSFIGRLVDGAPADERLSGSLGSAAIAIWNGAKIVRVHDVRETVEVVKVVDAIRKQI